MDQELIKILLVDDDEDDYVVTRDLLTEVDRWRHELEWVSNYETALKVMKRKEHDLFLLDYHLGEHTGLELMQEAIEDGCKTPVILLTGQGDHETDMEAMRAGAADYLVKGKIDAALLERSVRYAIERKKAEEQIIYLAYYDHLTSLPNRLLFKDRLQQALILAERYQRRSALLFLDLDNFKQVNDTLGHNVGDHLLKEVSHRLLDCIRKSDTVSRHNTIDIDSTVARLGGDEFTILLSEMMHDEDAVIVAQRVLDALSRPFVLEDHELYTTVSIGITLLPDDGKDIDSLIKNADIAMYQAKNKGKNNYQYFREPKTERPVNHSS